MDNGLPIAVLQFGFAGILLVYVYLVNTQFKSIVDLIDKHLDRLTRMLEGCEKFPRAEDQ